MHDARPGYGWACAAIRANEIRQSHFGRCARPELLPLYQHRVVRELVRRGDRPIGKVLLVAVDRLTDVDQRCSIWRAELTDGHPKLSQSWNGTVSRRLPLRGLR